MNIIYAFEEKTSRFLHDWISSVYHDCSFQNIIFDKSIIEIYSLLSKHKRVLLNESTILKIISLHFMILKNLIIPDYIDQNIKLKKIRT